MTMIMMDIVFFDFAHIGLIFIEISSFLFQLCTAIIIRILSYYIVILYSFKEGKGKDKNKGSPVYFRT